MVQIHMQQERPINRPTTMDNDEPYQFLSTFSTGVDLDFAAAFEADFNHASCALSTACSVFGRTEN